MFFSQTTGNVITFFNYETEQFKNYPVPTPESGPLGMIFASDNALWFTEFLANKIGRLNATDGTIKEYPLPASLAGPAVMRVETEGKYLWFTAFIGNAMGRIEMETGDVETFPNTEPPSFPAEDTLDSDGNVWFSTATKNTLNYVVPSTGAIVSIPEPPNVEGSPISVIPDANIAIHYGPGNAIWFADITTNKVGKYQLS